MTTSAKPPRVIVAFAVYTAVAVLIAALVIVYFVRANVEANAKSRVSQTSGALAAGVVTEIMRPADWQKPLTGARLTQVDRAVRARLLREGVLRVKLYNRAGTAIYVSDPKLIGTRFNDPAEFKKVLGGRHVTDITRLNHEGGSGHNVKAIESYVGVAYGGGRPSAGVFETYTDYKVAAVATRQQAAPLTIALLLVLLGLYLGLLPILRRTTRALEYSNNELRRRADDLNENLVHRAEIEERLRSTILDLERSENALTRSQEETIMRLSMAVESRDAETGGHIERMGRYCALIARKLGWSPERCDLLRTASPLHDVGKIAIPDSILQKPGALTPGERAEMERHAEIGHRILAGSDSPLLDLAAKIALTHHEQWDGTGYPNRVAGGDIPIEGRIAAIADVFDALTSDRVYRPAMPVEKAISIMTEGRGSHFDPELLDLFLASLDEVLAIRDGRMIDLEAERAAASQRRRRRRQRAVQEPAAEDADSSPARQSLVG